MIWDLLLIAILSWLIRSEIRNIERARGRNDGLLLWSSALFLIGGIGAIGVIAGWLNDVATEGILMALALGLLASGTIATREMRRGRL